MGTAGWYNARWLGIKEEKNLAAYSSMRMESICQRRRTAFEARMHTTLLHFTAALPQEAGGDGPSPALWPQIVPISMLRLVSPMGWGVRRSAEQRCGKCRYLL